MNRLKESSSDGSNKKYSEWEYTRRNGFGAIAQIWNEWHDLGLYTSTYGENSTFSRNLFPCLCMRIPTYRPKPNSLRHIFINFFNVLSYCYAAKKYFEIISFVLAIWTVGSLAPCSKGRFFCSIVSFVGQHCFHALKAYFAWAIRQKELNSFHCWKINGKTVGQKAWIFFRFVRRAAEMRRKFVYKFISLPVLCSLTL